MKVFHWDSVKYNTFFTRRAKNTSVQGHRPPQLSIRACPNTWLPKKLTSLHLQPIIAELCPAMVTYSPSNHSPWNQNIRLFLCLVLSKFIQKLNIALIWENSISSFSFPKAKWKNTGFWNLVIIYWWQKTTHRCIFRQFLHHLLSLISIQDKRHKWRLLFSKTDLGCTFDIHKRNCSNMSIVSLDTLSKFLLYGSAVIISVCLKFGGCWELYP